MSETSFARLRDWSEPAHPAVIRLYDDLIQIYRLMRERQADIDAAFDRVAAQIGYVVTTTLPVRVEVGEGGAVKGSHFDSEALRGTLFEKELSGFLQQLTAKPMRGVAAGSYRYYLIWYDALKLKLRRDWLEPVHVFRNLLGSIAATPAGVRAPISVWGQVHPEPAHWFDPGVAIAVEDAVVIFAIDEVYPELRLAERIAADRLTIRVFARRSWSRCTSASSSKSATFSVKCARFWASSRAEYQAAEISVRITPPPGSCVRPSGTKVQSASPAMSKQNSCVNVGLVNYTWEQRGDGFHVDSTQSVCASSQRRSKFATRCPNP